MRYHSATTLPGVSAMEDDPKAYFEKRMSHLERLSDGPPVAVYLDPGAFAWLKEIIEAKQHSLQWVPPYQRLVKRTLLSFQEAETGEKLMEDVELPEPPPPKKRTIPRRKR